MKIFPSTAIREWDAFTIQHEPITSTNLMERAAQVFTEWFTSIFPDSNQTISVFCGMGNNGGDGLAIARVLHRKFYEVKVFTVPITKIGSDDFYFNLRRLPKDIKLIELEYGDSFNVAEGDIIIDAILGSGLSKPIEGKLANFIKQLNALKNKKISVDIPSGLFADKITTSTCFHADYTLSFQAPKLAFFFPENNPIVGRWVFKNILLSPTFEKKNDCIYHFLIPREIKELIHKRDKFSHKGTYGHALILAGSKGKTGAAILAARACMRSGAGLLTCYIPSASLDIMQIALPEAMCLLDANADVISECPDLSVYNAIGIGPGIGKDKKTATALLQLLEKTKQAIVLDADALNIISENQYWLSLIPKNSILTPHPKEFDRLFGTSDNHWERLEVAMAYAQKYQFIIVLKGAFSRIVLPDGRCYFNSTGNPGMATAGSGDVLAGMITGFLAQGYEPNQAAILGVYIHGLAGDLAADTLSYESLMATDIIQNISKSIISIRR